jgi:thermitase
MKSAPKTIQHPTFGPSELVPSVVAVRWAAPRSPEDIDATLSELGLQRAKEEGGERKEGRRNPAELHVNQTAVLTFLSSGGNVTDKTLTKLEGLPDVAWVAPVYSAKRSEGGPRSYFAIDPTVLILSAAAMSAVETVAAIDPAAKINQTRTNLLKGFVALDLPNKNAIEAAERLQKSPGLGAIANAISFENIPYLSPTTCGCGGGCGGGGKKSSKSRKAGCTAQSTPFVPNDPLYPTQWGVQRINAPSAWPITQGDPNVVVAVLDEGVELGHPDLSLWPISYSTITHLYDGSPVGNHGTACAGIVSGRINSGTGMAGLAGKARVLAISTNWADVQIAEGLYFAADNGARVVSMSFGVYPSWMIWNFAINEAALQYCQDKNVLLVAASGNENINQSRFPGSDPRTLCVGGSNRDDVRKAVGDTSSEPFWGACWGPSVDVVAPCLEIPTTDRLGGAGYTPTDYDSFFNGTSSATPHVAALGALLFSVNPSLTSSEARQIISETTDKINAGAYIYLPTPGKPFGTWNQDVGYGRINVERALLVACPSVGPCQEDGPCAVCIPEPEECCVSPCDPPWRPDEQCLVWYEEKFFRVPFDQRDPQVPSSFVGALRTNFIEFKITYEHKMCLLGKQHGPLLFTTTLLPGETIHLYHSERYRRITSEQQRYSVQSTFMQFLSVVHQARLTGSIEALQKTLASASASSGSSSGGGFFFGLFGGGSSSESSGSVSVTSESMLNVRLTSEEFEQSVRQSSQLTHMERSLVVSTYEEKEIQDVTRRTLHNANECRAVTYFVRQVVELYAISTRVIDIRYRIVAPNVPAVWHAWDDVAWLPDSIRKQIESTLALLPKVGEVTMAPRPFTLPTDGTVYDPELAHCCSCEPERAAAISIRLQKEKAEALKACLEVERLETELQRRRLLLQKGELAQFDTNAGG